MNEKQTQTGQSQADEKSQGQKETTQRGTARGDRTPSGAGEIKDPHQDNGQPNAAFNLIWEKAQKRKRILSGEAAAAHPAHAEES